MFALLSNAYAHGRGGRGGSEDLSMMLAVAAIFAIGWLITVVGKKSPDLGPTLIVLIMVLGACAGLANVIVFFTNIGDEFTLPIAAGLFALLLIAIAKWPSGKGQGK